MNRLIRTGVLLAAALTLLLAGCGGKEAASGSHSGSGSPQESSVLAYHKITAEEGKRMMDEGNVTVVDVRRTDEYQAGHIPGAICVPNEGIGSEQPEALPDLDGVLVVYCHTGVRSKQASDKLVEIGYRNVYDMGGIVDWPYDIAKGDEADEQ
ncbi:rhodanese-like domain-containing protein [Zongyangia hominis]|uniref:Rhodanese-like domain-containing protein n=1 Tax=Zongyangia hominis TaxID=2763677 RepID=A0A926EBR3_9FIRM|nr:rhodanese-like domain-containing protein [Zongyangia hominis]MBC8569319.1 rhodanese-like domain-containing protein [Zongyangia hominis]